MDIKSTFVPDDWQPAPILPIYSSRIDPGVDRDKELMLFRLHEFQSPKSNFDRAWIQWLIRAKPQKSYADKDLDNRRSTVRPSESKNPALVAERMASGPKRF